VTEAVLQDEPRIAQKAAIRTAALARRDAIAPEYRASAAEVIAKRPLPITVERGMIVSGFMPIRSEINPLPLLHRLAEAGARLALPAIQGRGRPLALRAWTIGAPLVRGQWGIREPGADAETVVPDLLIVPLAAFDRRGGRIGYGAGYFDMTIAQARAQKHAVAIGIAFAAQETESVPVMPHDQPLDFVLTERETIDCRGA
jgi:5-formyltetrahydrofolate cyclo-ligase